MSNVESESISSLEKWSIKARNISALGALATYAAFAATGLAIFEIGTAINVGQTGAGELGRRVGKSRRLRKKGSV